MSLKSLVTVIALGLALSGTAVAGKSPNHGVVTQIEVRQVEAPSEASSQDDNNLTGTAVGAAAGALLGRSVSGKKDHAKGALIGAVVGGIAGNQVQKHMKDGDSSVAYRDVFIVHVRFDDGSRDSFEYDEEPDYREGDRIKLRDGRLRRE